MSGRDNDGDRAGRVHAHRTPRPALVLGAALLAALTAYALWVTDDVPPDPCRPLPDAPTDGLQRCFFPALGSDSLVLVHTPAHRCPLPSASPGQPARDVEAGALWVGETELTRRQVRAAASLEKLPLLMSRDSPDQALVMVTWCDVVQIANLTSQAVGLAPVYDGVDTCFQTLGTSVTWDRTRDGLRLPTSEEWTCIAPKEPPLSARVGKPLTQSTQEDRRIRQGAPNPFGLYGLHGAVGELAWERCTPEEMQQTTASWRPFLYDPRSGAALPAFRVWGAAHVDPDAVQCVTTELTTEAWGARLVRGASP